MRSHNSRASRALEWIARLPLLGEPELARLLRIDEVDARGLRRVLERQGWIEWFVPGSDALQQRRLSFVREEVLPELAAALGIGLGALPAHLAVLRRDLLARIVRVELTASVNRFFSELTSWPALPGLELEDARSLPLARSRAGRWWLSSVEGYGCLRAGPLRAPFFVAWDRAAAPNLHRRARVDVWFSTATAVTAHWGAEGLPPLLLVCADRRARATWERSIRRAAERMDGWPPEVLLTNARELAADSPGGATWHDPVSGRAGPLLERLGWGEAPPFPRLRLPDELVAPPQPGAALTLRRWAPAAAADSRTPTVERGAAIAMTTDRDEKRLLEWVGRLPLVTTPQLASLTDLPEAAAERRLERLLRSSVVRFDSDVAPGDSPGRHLVLTPLGLRLLARRDGVPPARYARFAGVSAPRPNSGASSVRGAEIGIIHHRAHLLGVNRVMAQFARDARRAGGRLAVCRNEAQSTRRFRYEGRAAWIRPDGSGVLVLDGGPLPFVLEYDRGTLDSGDFGAKFGGYRRYFAAEAWCNDFAAEPVLLFVCADDRAEEHVARAARENRGGFAELPLLLAGESQSAPHARNPAGLLRPIWRSPYLEPGVPAEQPSPRQFPAAAGPAEEHYLGRRGPDV